jgi:hypothetical protein
VLVVPSLILKGGIDIERPVTLTEGTNREAACYEELLLV